MLGKSLYILSLDICQHAVNYSQDYVVSMITSTSLHGLHFCELHHTPQFGPNVTM